MTEIMAIRAVRVSELPEDTQEVLRDIPRFTSDHQYFQANREALLRDYDGQWVAVYRQEVIAADTDRDRVIAAVKGRNIMPSSVAVHFVTSKERLCFF